MAIKSNKLANTLLLHVIEKKELQICEYLQVSGNPVANGGRPCG
jgi:hypothetical protein